MDLFDLFRVVRRRLNIIIPIGLLALGLAVVVQMTIPPVYEANGYLEWDLPQYDAPQDRVSDLLDPAALSVGIELTGDASYAVGPLEGQNFVISATAGSAEAARTAVNEVVAELGARISAVQDDENVTASQQLDLRTVTSDPVLEALSDDTVIATAQVFLNDPIADLVNPYNPNASTGRILQVAVSSDAGLDAFERLAGPDLEFEVVQQARDSAALLAVVVRGSEEARVLLGFDAVTELLNEELDARQEQAGVPLSQRISLRALDAPSSVEDISPPVHRAVVGIVGLGGLLALGAAFVVERRHTTARTRSASSTGSISTDSGQQTTPDALDRFLKQQTRPRTPDT